MGILSFYFFECPRQGTTENGILKTERDEGDLKFMNQIAPSSYRDIIESHISFVIAEILKRGSTFIIRSRSAERRRLLNLLHRKQ